MKQRDLFDRGDQSQPGERQTDLEDLIYENSLLGLIEAGDEAGEQEWVERAKRGEILRIM